MKQHPQIFHGEWWVPAVADQDLDIFLDEPKKLMGLESKYTGTLVYYEDEVSTLELYHIPSNFHSKQYHQNNVMWGADANGNIFTLFDVEMQDKNSVDFSTTTFNVSIILLGEHILSLDDAVVGKCIVQFPYLRNWAFHNNLIFQKNADNVNYTLNDVKPNNYLVESQVEDNLKWLLRDKKTIPVKTKFDLSIAQTTEFVIESSKGISYRDCFYQISAFSQFLSIALYCEQSPSVVSFYNKSTNRYSLLLFEKEDSSAPKNSTLIKFDELKEKIPAMFRVWYENYNNISPISKYLIDSLRKTKTFDVPDFLIIAQALDGYHKRFVNKKNGGKDHRKYEDGIIILLKQFKDVDYVKECHIDPIVLRDSRDKYSHLYPDSEESKAVEGEKLYWLTEKCKILLTCCILNLMGLTNEEINLCFRCSPIQEFVISHLFDFYHE